MADDFNSLVPTTQIWDASEIKSMDVNSDEFKEFLVLLYQRLNQMAIATNARDIAKYDTQEVICGQEFFPNPTYGISVNSDPIPRGAYRKVINFGALPNSTSTSVAHGIITTPGFTVTRLYGAASNTGSSSYISIPYVSASGNVSLSMSSTNVTITTTGSFSGYTTAYVIVEYLKN